MGFSRNSNTTLAQEENRVNALQYSQSTYGTTKQIVYGTQDICGNLIDSVDFTAIEHKQSVKTGKGGGGSQTSTSYTYKARILVGLCYGTIQGIKKVTFDDGIYSLSQLNFSFFNGSNSQNAWGEMVSLHPDHALNYRNLAYVAGYVDLTTSGGVPQYHFEVAGKCISNGLDANPKDVMLDVLTNSIYGAGFPSSYLDSASFNTFSQFCIANNLFLSPIYDAQEEVQECLTELAEICNSTFIWTQGKLKIMPLCDETVRGNGASYTPNLTPVYDFDESDFLDDEEPVICTRSNQADVYNSIKIEYKNRANNYATEVVEAQDLANIELYGLRVADTQKAHQICRTDIAQRTAQLALERNIAVRNKYKFKVPFRFILLDAMDIVTLTCPKLGLDREPVRILSIKENGLKLEIEAEEMVIGSASPAKIETQEAIAMSIDANQSIGNVNPIVVFEPPMELTQNTLEVWLGISSSHNLFGGCEVYISDDDSTYKLIGKMTTQARQGVLKTMLPGSLVNPDTTNELVVDMNMSNSELLSGTKEDADRLNTLCYVDGEFLAYQTAELDDIGIYNLKYLNRGAYASENKPHYEGSQFVRIDEDAFLRIPFNKEDIGKKVSIKCLTFNTFGGGIQTLSDVQPFYYQIKGSALKQAPENVRGLTDYYSDGLNIVKWQPVDDARSIVYEVRKGASWAKGQCLGRVAETSFTANGNGTYWVKAYVPDYGVYSEVAAAIEIDGARLVKNVIVTADEYAEGWNGRRSSSVIVNELGLLELTGGGLVSQIPVFSEIKSLLYYGGIAQNGTYEADCVVDIGAAASCYIAINSSFFGENPFNLVSKITVFSEITSLIGNYASEIADSRIQIAIAGNNGEFGAWKDFISGQHYGRKFKFRAILASSSDTVVAKMNQFSISVDVPDIVETGTAVVIPTTGKTIQFEKNFHIEPNVQVTILNKTQGDDEVISNISEDSFDLIIYNNGTAVEKTINFVAQGY